MSEAVSSGEQSAMAMEVEMNKEERGEEMKRVSSKDGSSSVVRWERFLPRMVVRVLLVEADDSTRQIISALLRKCNYKVAAVADGLRAWEVLKERSRSIDLILTEIDLPSISGFALLSLIAEDDICKNIPVIIMSSHDSIGTVHKCMMRGAADFLMKPIRINELKNLWQHVWRRQSCQSAMGCGLSLQVESAAQLKVDEATAENDAVSDRSCGSKNLLQREDGCLKKGSDAQSSCTNPSLEARSACAEEGSQGLCRTKKRKPPVGDAEVPQDDDGSGKNLCTRANIVAGSDDDLCKSRHTQGGKPEGHSPVVIGNDLASQDSERTTTRAESSREAIDLIGAFDNKGSYAPSCSNSGPKIFESSELNLSWRGFHLTGLESNTNQINKVLIHSNVSAFSRYTNKQSQLVPRESTMNAVEPFPIHVRANYSETNGGPSTYNRSAETLPMHHREEPEVSLPYEQQRLYPIHIETRDANYTKHHFGADRATHEQRFMCIDEREVLEQLVESMDKKTRFSPATDQSGSDSFCNGAVTHTNWHGTMCATSNGNVNPSMHPTISAQENGNVDERFLPLDKKTQREAALMKFRMKRKERCYEKKVRYESRKKLADQRPRVKGQFVRHIPPDPPPNPEPEYA